MFIEFEKVRVINTGIIGTIVDKHTSNGKTVYIVESDEKFQKVEGYGNLWPLYDCTEQEIEAVR